MYRASIALQNRLLSSASQVLTAAVNTGMEALVRTCTCGGREEKSYLIGWPGKKVTQ